MSSREVDDEDAEAEISSITVGTPARGDVKSLRARLWTLASRLAQRNGLGDLVHPLSGQGLGFALRDVPDPALVDQLDEDALAQVSMVWWHLAACAELTVAPLDALLPALPEDSVLRRALVEQDAGLLFASVWTLDPGLGFGEVSGSDLRTPLNSMRKLVLGGRQNRLRRNFSTQNVAV